MIPKACGIHARRRQGTHLPDNVGEKIESVGEAGFRRIVTLFAFSRG